MTHPRSRWNRPAGEPFLASLFARWLSFVEPERGSVDVVDVTRFVRRPPQGFPRLGATALVALSAASIGCGGPPSDQPDPLAGAELVSGTSLPRHGLLVLAHGGGVAEFRSAGDPSSVRWTGRIELPAATAAHPLGRSAVIRHADGAS